MSPAAADEPGLAGTDRSPLGVQQDASASDRAQLALQAQGVQNNYFGWQQPPPEAALSIAPPTGLRDPARPLRGRNEEVTELARPGLGIQVLCGMGGCGKTRLALEAAVTAQQDGAQVWWVTAAQETSLQAGMRAVGRRLGLSDTALEHGDAADLIWQFLTSWQDRWLLVIDGADDPRLLAGAGNAVADGRGWLRPLSSPCGTVLVTSRDGSPGHWGPWCQRRRLGMLRRDQAAAVLADHAGDHPALGGSDDARKLATRLGGLPLALKIAGAYLAEAATTPAVFADQNAIRSYQEYRDALDSGRAEAVFTASGGQLGDAAARGLIGQTWELTLDLLDARQLPEARLLLWLLAGLADAPIPYQILLQPAALAADPLFDGITGPRLWQALQALDSFGLLDLGTSDDPDPVPVAQLHPLVRDTSHPAADEQRMAFLRLAARLLRRAAGQETASPEDPSAWPAWRLLAPHAAHILESLTARPDHPDDTTELAAYAAHMAARFQAAQGLHAAAEAEYRDVLAARLRVLGADHPSTLATRHCIALEMGARGDHAGAEAEYRDVFAAEMRVLGPDHPSTLATRHCIALERAERGDHVAAEAEYRDVLAVRLRVLGPDHPDTLATRHCLALEMGARGDHAGAEAEYRDVLAATQRVLGPDHPDALTTWQQIAMERAERGDHVGAEAEYRDVLAARLRVLGPDHPDTLTTRHCIALEMAARGDHADAEAEYRAVLADKLRVLGPDHPSTQTTSRSLEYLARLKNR